MELKVVELFAGVGGFRVGLNKITDINTDTEKAVEKGNWDFVWANQYEPSTKVQHAFNCYITRFGEDSCSNLDINKVDKSTIPNHSLLVGGFPCQDYSVARSLSNEQGIEGKKGVLFWDIKDVLKEKKSPFVLLENVDRLLKSPASMRGRDFSVMLKTFDTLGYHVSWRVINAADYGMPQRRKRIFIFAFKKESKYANWFKDQAIDELLYSNLLNKTFPIKEKKYVLNEIDLNKYDNILDISDNFREGKFLTSGYMIDGIVYHTDIEPLTEKVYSLKMILKKAEKFNPKDKKEYIVEDEKLDKWKYLKGSKRIERIAQNVTHQQ